MDNNKKYTTTYKKLTETTAEVLGVLSVSCVEVEVEHAAKELSKDKEVKGFRKGEVPSNVLSSIIGEAPIWERAARHAIQKIYHSIIKTHSIEPIGSPSLSFIKIAPKNEVEFRFEFTTLPQFDLPDYKEIAKGGGGVETAKLEENDLSVALRSIQEGLYRRDNPNTTDIPKNIILPAITDEVVQKLSDKYKTVDEFKEGVKETIVKEKQSKLQTDRREKIAQQLIDKTKFELPKIFIDTEVEGHIQQLKADAERFKTSFEKYLEHIKKTEDEFRQSLRVDAEKRARLQLILNSIAKKEEVKIDENILNEETKRFHEKYKQENIEHIKVHINTIMVNEKVFQLLEQIADSA